MTRAKLDLSGFDEPAQVHKDPVALREISERAGFPSRQAAPPAAPVAEQPNSPGFRRPVRQSGNRNIAMNVRVGELTANRMYALRDADPSQKRSLADVIDDAVALLYEREFSTAAD